MCKYSYDRSKHKCQRDNLPDSEYCIFHLQDDKKDLNKFNNGIHKIIDEENPIDFTGFYFPPGTADFSYKNFQKYVFFGDVIFSGIANFGDAHFIEVNFNGTTFLKIANFEGATFLERARFVGAKFYNKTYFNKANFCSEADFNGAEFLRSEISNIKTTGSLKTKIPRENKSNKAFKSRTKAKNLQILDFWDRLAKGKSEVKFDGAKFLGLVDFHGVLFSVDVSFRDVKFLGNEIIKFWMTEFSNAAVANFSGAEFSGETYFSNSQFFGKVYFRSTKFLNFITFDSADFLSESVVDFYDAEFSEYVDFKRSNFFGKVKFNHAKFSEEISFIETIFHENFDKVDFEKTKFLKKVEFNKAMFLRDANFNKCTFFEDAVFDEAKFLKTVTFIKGKFSGRTSFKHTEFFNIVDFSDSILAGKTDFNPTKSEMVFFNNTFFLEYVKIKANLTQCNFYDSNIENVDLTGSSWAINNKKNIIIFEEWEGRLSWKELEDIYRHLKQSHQKHGDYSLAGEFYYKEMECRGKQLTGFKKFAWIVLFERISGYGEKPSNVVWSSVYIIFVSAFFYFYCGIEFIGSSVLKVPPHLLKYNFSPNYIGIQWVMGNIDKVFNDFLLCLYTSVITFTTLGYGDVHPIGYSRIVASVEAIFGIFMTALFIFVFTRKMLR